MITALLLIFGFIGFMIWTGHMYARGYNACLADAEKLREFRAAQVLSELRR